MGFDRNLPPEEHAFHMKTKERTQSSFLMNTTLFECFFCNVDFTSTREFYCAAPLASQCIYISVTQNRCVLMILAGELSSSPIRGDRLDAVSMYPN